MIERDQRLVVMAENRAGAAPWYQLAYERLLQETPFTFTKPAQLTDPATLAATCRPNRGPSTAPLFLVNHWINTDPAPRPSHAEIVNAYGPLLRRATTCREIRDRVPNLLAVDFYKRGDLFRVVDTLNGVGAVRDRLGRWLRAVSVDVDLLRRRRELRLLILGQATSDLGSMITFVAVPVQTYQLTHSSVAVGLLGVAEFVPILVLALVGGGLADAFDRRRLVMLAEVGATLIVAGLVVNSLLPDPQLWVLYVAAALIAACTAIRRPPMDALMPQLVERTELKSASALQWAIHGVAQMAGPAIAGVLIATAGAAVTYTADLATFAVSIASLVAMRTSPPHERQALGSARDRRGPALRGLEAGTGRHVRNRHQRDVLRHADGAVPGDRRALRRRRGGRPAVRGAVGGRRDGDADERLDAPRPPSRPDGGARRDRLGRRDRGLRPRAHARARPPRALPSRAEPTRSPVSFAARSGTRRSRPACAAASRASR